MGYNCFFRNLRDTHRPSLHSRPLCSHFSLESKNHRQRNYQKRFLPMLKGIANGSVVTRWPATLMSREARSPYPSRSIKRLITWGSASVCEEHHSRKRSQQQRFDNERSKTIIRKCIRQNGTTTNTTKRFSTTNTAKPLDNEHSKTNKQGQKATASPGATAITACDEQTQKGAYRTLQDRGAEEMGLYRAVNHKQIVEGAWGDGYRT